MSRKIFISVLGAGYYLPSVYGCDDFKSSNTRYVQEATLEYLNVKDWTADDAVYILLTDKARTTHWQNTTDSKTGETIKGLAEIIKDMSLQCTCEGVSIQDGVKENEMWNIFQTLYGLVQDNDDIYIDLTHGFRYLPMLVVVFGNYAKFLKNATIKHLSYGNFEAKKQYELDYAPFVDLLPLSVLQDWTAASADFLKNGNTTQLSELSNKTFASRFKQELDDSEKLYLTELSSFVNKLNILTQGMRLCRGSEILSDRWGQIQEQAKVIKTRATIPPLAPLIEKIESSFAGFKPGIDVTNGYHAFLWCYEHKLYQQAITILEETIISHMVENVNLACDKLNDRELVSRTLNSLNPNSTRKHDDSGNAQVMNLQNVLENLDIFPKVAPLYWDLQSLRNDVNHCGFLKESTKKTAKLVTRLEKFVTKIEELVE